MGRKPLDVGNSSRTSASVHQLVRAYADGDPGAGDELQRRGVLEGRPKSPAGEYARHLVAEVMGGARVSNDSSHGVIADGQRIQVHGRHIKPYREPNYFPVTFDPEQASFDRLVAVLFEVDWTVEGAWEVPWKALPDLCRKYPGTGYRLMLRGEWTVDPRVRQLHLDAR